MNQIHHRQLMLMHRLCIVNGKIQKEKIKNMKILSSKYMVDVHFEYDDD